MKGENLSSLSTVLSLKPQAECRLGCFSAWSVSWRLEHKKCRKDMDIVWGNDWNVLYLGKWVCSSSFNVTWCGLCVFADIRATESTEEVTKLRPVRLIREDGIIRPYDLTESKGYDLFQVWYTVWYDSSIRGSSEDLYFITQSQESSSSGYVPEIDPSHCAAQWQPEAGGLSAAGKTARAASGQEHGPGLLHIWTAVTRQIVSSAAARELSV